MRRLLTSAFILAALPLVAQVVWLQPDHDFGSFHEDLGIVTCTFMGVNTGSQPASLIDVRANCGCTTPIYSHNPVEPGDTIKIKVGYNPSGRPGKFSKAIYATTDDGVKTTFHIKGTVIGASNTLASRFPVDAAPARLSNSILPFGKLLKGHSGAQTLKIYNASSSPITPSIISSPKHLHAIIEPAVIPAGDQGIISVTAYPDQTQAWGLTTDTLLLRPDSNAATTVPLTTVMIIEEDFSALTPQQLTKAPALKLSADLIDLAQISTLPEVIKRSVTFTNTGKSPLLIRSISTPDRAISFSPYPMKPIKPGKKATLDIYIHKDALSGRSMLNSRITIITNSPARPTEIIRVTGEL